MKVLVLHSSGNVGKSLITREVFYQNFVSDSKMVLEIESHNASSSSYNMNVVRIDFDKPSTLQVLTQYGIIYDDYILDVGASEIKDFLLSIGKTKEIFEEFDLIVVPTLKNQKVIADTKKTMAIIRHLGIESKLQVLFNCVTNSTTIEDDFSSLYDWAKQEKFNLDSNLYFSDYSEQINDLSKQKLLSSELLEDKADYRALALEYHQKGDAENSRKASNKLLTRRIVKSMNADAFELFLKFKKIVGSQL